MERGRPVLKHKVTKLMKAELRLTPNLIVSKVILFIITFHHITKAEGNEMNDLFLSISA